MRSDVGVGAALMMASVLVCASVAGCSVRSPRSLVAGQSPTKSPLVKPTLRAGETRSAPDPRTLLSPALRAELMRNADSKGTRCKRGVFSIAEDWNCFISTRYPGTDDSDEIEIKLAVYLPMLGQGATDHAIEEYASDTREITGRHLEQYSLGDQAIETRPDPSALKAHQIVFRVGNVVASVSVREWRTATRADDVAWVSAEQQLWARRLAADLAQAIPGLPH